MFIGRRKRRNPTRLPAIRGTNYAETFGGFLQLFSPNYVATLS